MTSRFPLSVAIVRYLIYFGDEGSFFRESSNYSEVSLKKSEGY